MAKKRTKRKQPYTVTITKKLSQSITVTVKAADEEEAKSLASDAAEEADEDDWEFDGDFTEFEIFARKGDI